MRFPFLLFVALFPFCGVTQYTSSLPIIAYDNCEFDPVYQWGGDRTKKWSYWTGADHILPGSSTTASMTRSRTYVRKGSYSYKARITKDLTYTESNNTFRSELNFSTPSQQPIGWRWAAVSIFIPEDFCVDYVPMTIAFNTKASPDDYATPFRLDTRNGRYYAVRANIQTNGSVPGEIATDLGPIDKGQWVDWVYNRNFTQNTSGYQRLYKNGVLVWSYNGPNWKTGSGRAAEGYMQQGLYKWPWISPNGEGWGPPSCNNPIEVFYDEYKWGDNNATLQSFHIPTAPPLVPPVVDIPISDQTMVANTSPDPVSLQNVFTDEKGAANLTLSVSAISNTALVSGASISGKQLTLTLQPGVSGTALIKVRATDSDGFFVEDEFQVTVTAPIAVAPLLIVPISDLNVLSATTQNIPLNEVFSDDEGLHNITYSITGNTNPSLITETSIISSSLILTIAAGVFGSALIKIRATDSDGLFIEDEFLITVDPPLPQPPLVTNPIGDQEIAFNSTNQPINFLIPLENVFIDDRGLNNITYNISSNTNTALITESTINGTNLILALAPGLSGSSTITVRATDSDGLFVEDQFSITVTAAIPVAPTLINPISDQTVPFNTTSTIISLNNVFSDDEGNGNISFSITGNSNNSLITGNSIDGNSLTLSIAPGLSGSSTITVRATDSDGLFVEDQFNITVAAAIPVAPTLVNPINDQTVPFNTTSTIISLNNVFSDEEGNSNISFSITGNSNNSLITDNSIDGNSLTLSIAPGLSGSSTVTVRATDSDGLFVEDQFNITVAAAIPVAPTVSNPISDQTVPFNTASTIISLNNVFSDDEGNGNISFSITGNSNNSLITDNTIDGNTLTLSIAPGLSGSSTITVRATDNDGLFVEDQFNITVAAAIPVAPTVSNPISDQTVPFNTASTIISLNNVFSDDEGNSNISFSITSNSNNSLITGNSIDGNSLTLSIAPGLSGSSTITVRATDNDGLFVEDQFSITVADAIPVAPTLVNPISDQNVPFNTTSTIISLNNVFSDDEGNSNISFSITGNSNNSLITGNSIDGNSLSLSIAPGLSGSSTITVRATDSDGLFVEDQFSITVAAATPVAPTLSNPISDQTVPFNTPSTSVSLNNVFSDDEGNGNISFSITGNSNSSLITNTSIDGNSITLSIAPGLSGSSTITVRATDSDGLFVEDQFSITVAAAIPVAPTLVNPISDQTVPFNTASTIISLNNVFSDDEGNGNIIFSITGNSNNSLITGNSIDGNSLTLSIAPGLSGSSTITVRATDTDGLFVEDQFILTVSPPPAVAPVIVSPISDQSSVFNATSKTVSFTNTFTDDEGLSNLTYTISGNSNTALVTNATISGTTITLSIAAGLSGSSTITVRATDSDGLFVEDQFILTVSPPPAVAPVIASPIPDQSSVFNATSKTVSFTNTFTDDEGLSNLTYTISGNSNTALVTNATISGTTITLSIAAGLSGSSTIKLKATDSDGLFAEDQFVLTVAAPAPTTILINSGGPSFSFQGNTWSADKNFSGGSTLTNNVNIAGTTNDQLYQTERNGNHSYSIPVTNGRYTVKLHFAEISFNGSNKRKFNVNIENGQGTLTNYDIFSKAGGSKRAVVEQFTINVADGDLNIAFVNVKDKAKISGIEITSSATTRVASGISAVISEKQFENISNETIGVVNVFPNPFSTSVNISFNIEHSGKVSMQLVNSNGQIIRQYPAEYIQGRSVYRKEFQAGNHPSGIYYYRIMTDTGEIKTGRIILAR